MTPQHCKIIQLLATGEFLSGQMLGEKLQITRSAVWKIIHSLQQKKISIECVHGKGYRIPGGLQLYNEHQLLNYLSHIINKYPIDLNILMSVDSTNTYVRRQLKNYPNRQYICLAEEQIAGRGRCQRNWISPFAKNIYLTVSWNFSGGPAALAGLSLVIGLALVNTLSTYSISDLKLKWPNDVYWRDHKLAGILTEILIDDLGLCQSVIGIGINLDMPEQCASEIGQPYIDCKSILGYCLDKNQLVAQLIETLFTLIPLFEKSGLNYFKNSWEKYDYLFNKQITITCGQLNITGTAKGINEQGGLLVEHNQKKEVFNAGEVSVRVSEHDVVN